MLSRAAPISPVRAVDAGAAEWRAAVIRFGSPSARG